MTFYERLETLREKKGKSQRAIEKELGFSTGSYGKWKTKMPTSDRMSKLANYFDVSVEYLLGSENYKKDNNTNTWEYVISTENMQLFVDVMKEKDSAERLLAYAKKLLELKNMEDVL